MLQNLVESASLSVAGDICELAAACLTKFLLLGLNVQYTVHFKTGIKVIGSTARIVVIIFLPLDFEIFYNFQ